MKKLFTLIVILCVLLMYPIAAQAEADDADIDFTEMFDLHGSVMLLIDAQTGMIQYANDAACQFYGYTKQQLESMSITQINTLEPQEIELEMQAAINEQRNFFVFKHRLADGQMRTVEVFSYPVSYNNQTFLLSNIHDITDKTLLMEREEQTLVVILIVGTIAIISLTMLIYLLARNTRKLKITNALYEDKNQLNKTFIDADDRLIYLKDENLKYVFVNKAFEKFYGVESQDVIGVDDFALTCDEFANKRRDTDIAVLEHRSRIVDRVEWDGRVYRTTKFPVRMINGNYGVGAYIKDISQEWEHEKRQDKSLHRHMILSDVLTRSFDSTHEQLDYVLSEALKLTESQYGYIYLYDEQKSELDRKSTRLNSSHKAE